MPELTAGQSINKALSLILESNQSAFIAGEDIGIYGGAFGVTEGLLEKFGNERIKDTPISEDVIAGLAVGASMTGSRPIVEMQFSDFIVNAMDPIVNQAAKLHFMYGGAVNVPIVVEPPTESITVTNLAVALLLTRRTTVALPNVEAPAALVPHAASVPFIKVLDIILPLVVQYLPHFHLQFHHQKLKKKHLV